MIKIPHVTPACRSAVTGACDAGTYANATEQGVCKACPFGTFQPERWQQFCVSCPAGFTAYQEAAVSLDVCLREFTSFVLPCISGILLAAWTLLQFHTLYVLATRFYKVR